MLFPLGLLLAGCDRQESIQSYRVPKASVVYELNHVEGSKPPAQAAAGRPERMLAAIVPQGQGDWYFKLTGPPEQVEQAAGAFHTFVESLKFTDPESPEWELPAGWKRLPGNEARFATLQVPSGGEKPLDLSVVTLPRLEKDETAFLLANINRWRGQLQLQPIKADDVADETEELKIGDTTAWLVDFEGLAGSARRPPFAGMTQASPDAGPPAALTPQTGASKLKFDAPQEWQAGAAGGMRKAAFAVADGNQKAEITVIDLEPAASALLPNINRWRNQVGLSEVSQAELDKTLKPIVVDGKTGAYVELAGPGSTGKPQTILGVVVQHSGRAWFIKLMGDRDLAARERERFEGFVKSIKFAAAEGTNDGK